MSCEASMKKIGKFVENFSRLRNFPRLIRHQVFKDKIERNSGCVKFIKNDKNLAFLMHYLTYRREKENIVSEFAYGSSEIQPFARPCTTRHR